MRLSNVWGAVVATALATAVVAAPSPALAQASIQGGSLAELDPWMVGSLGRADAALPRTLWSGSDPAALAALFDRLPPTFASPAATRLVRSALLSPGSAPAGDTMLAARKRFEALAKFGLADELVIMASGSAAAKADPGIALYTAQADVARGRLHDACRRIQTAEFADTPAFVLRLRALCFAANGEGESAQLALEVARNSGKGDAWLQSVIAIIGGTPSRPPPARYDSSLNTAASLMAKLKPAAQTPLSKSSAFSLALLARSGDAPPDLRVSAASQLLANGALAPNVARAAFRAAPAGPKSPALVRAAAELEVAANTPAKALAIEGALKGAKSHGAFATAAALFAADLASLPADASTAPAAPVFTRAALVLGDAAGVRKWRALIPSSFGAGQLAAIDMADAVWRDDGALAVDAVRRRLQLTPTDVAGLATRDLLVLRAMGLLDGEPAKAFLAVHPAAAGKSPDNLAQITAAAERGAAGETALQAALAIASGAETLDGRALETILAALYKVGLKAQARVVAVEALIGGQSR